MTRKTGNWKALAFPVVLCYATASVLVAPWIIYNFITYGDPLGWSVILATTPIRIEPMTWMDATGIVQGLFTSFWGRFGGALHLHMANWVYAPLGILALIGLSGWVGYARDARGRRLASSARESLILFGLFWAVMLSAYVRWSFVVLGADQARQLFPGLPLFAILFAAGWARWLRARRMLVFVSWAFGLLGINLGALVYLRATFAGVS